MLVLYKHVWVYGSWEVRGGREAIKIISENIIIPFLILHSRLKQRRKIKGNELKT